MFVSGAFTPTIDSSCVCCTSRWKKKHGTFSPVSCPESSRPVYSVSPKARVSTRLVQLDFDSSVRHPSCFVHCLPEVYFLCLFPFRLPGTGPSLSRGSSPGSSGIETAKGFRSFLTEKFREFWFSPIWNGERENAGLGLPSAISNWETAKREWKWWKRSFPGPRVQQHNTYKTYTNTYTRKKKKIHVGCDGGVKLPLSMARWIAVKEHKR